MNLSFPLRRVDRPTPKDRRENKCRVVSVAGVGQSEAKETPVDREELRERTMNSTPL